MDESESARPATRGDRQVVIDRACSTYFELQERGQAPPVEIFVQRYLTHVQGDILELLRDASSEFARFPEHGRTVPASGLVDLEEALIPNHRLIKPIGRGGYGQVYLAEYVLDPQIRRAVKILSGNHPGAAEEIQAICEVYRVFQATGETEGLVVPIDVPGETFDPEGNPWSYYFMTLADEASEGSSGPAIDYRPLTLAEILKRPGSPAVATVLAIARDLTRGLTTLHRKGYLHRDIKPANVVRVGGTWKFADLGQVVSYHRARRGGGTPPYADPTSRPGAAASDLVPLGRSLYQVATKGNPGDRAEFERWSDSLEGFGSDSQHFKLGLIITKACKGEYRSVEKMATDIDAALGLVIRKPGRLDVRLSRRSADGTFQSLMADREPPRELRGLKMARSNSGPIRVKVGDQIRIEAYAARIGFLTVFNLDSTGSIEMLTLDPKRGGRPNPIGPNQPYRREIDVTPPTGTDRLFAVWTREPEGLDDDAIKN